MLDIFWFNYCKFLIWLFGYKNILFLKDTEGSIIYNIAKNKEYPIKGTQLISWKSGEFDELERWLKTKNIDPIEVKNVDAN